VFFSEVKSSREIFPYEIQSSRLLYVFKIDFKLKIKNELYSILIKQYFNNTLVLMAGGGHGKLIKALIIIYNYPPKGR